jgi:hypothetical protein
VVGGVSGVDAGRGGLPGGVPEWVAELFYWVTGVFYPLLDAAKVMAAAGVWVASGAAYELAASGLGEVARGAEGVTAGAVSGPLAAAISGQAAAAAQQAGARQQAGGYLADVAAAAVGLRMQTIAFAAQIAASPVEDALTGGTAAGLELLIIRLGAGRAILDTALGKLATVIARDAFTQILGQQTVTLAALAGEQAAGLHPDWAAALITGAQVGAWGVPLGAHVHPAGHLAIRYLPGPSPLHTAGRYATHTAAGIGHNFGHTASFYPLKGQPADTNPADTTYPLAADAATYQVEPQGAGHSPKSLGTLPRAGTGGTCAGLSRPAGKPKVEFWGERGTQHPPLCTPS